LKNKNVEEKRRLKKPYTIGLLSRYILIKNNGNRDPDGYRENSEAAPIVIGMQAELSPHFVRATKLNYEFYPAMTAGHFAGYTNLFKNISEILV